MIIEGQWFTCYRTFDNPIELHETSKHLPPLGYVSRNYLEGMPTVRGSWIFPNKSDTPQSQAEVLSCPHVHLERSGAKHFWRFLCPNEEFAVSVQGSEFFC